MKKITIMALHLGYGGIEKAITDLSNALSHDYNIEIVSTYKIYDEPVNKLNDNITVKYLIEKEKPNREEFKAACKKLKFLSIIKEGFKSLKILYLKKKLMINYIKKCQSDIIISSRTFHNNILSKYGNKKSIRIGWEHNYHNNDQKYISNLISSVKGLDYFVVVSNTLYSDYKKLLNNCKCKCVYIPNMVNINTSKLSKANNNNLITVSRLSDEKGLFDMIDVVDIIKESISTIQLNIIGDGVLFDKLRGYIKEKNLSENIHLLGFMKSEDVYRYYMDSSLYVMTSFTESFGIVLLESFSFGVPAIAFDSASGACELINKDNGFLIPNRDKKLMADTIIEYLNSKDLRKDMSCGTQKNLLRYTPDYVSNMWKELFR